MLDNYDVSEEIGSGLGSVIYVFMNSRYLLESSGGDETVCYMVTKVTGC